MMNVAVNAIASDERLDADQLYTLGQQLEKNLRARAVETEKNRILPVETMNEMREKGLLRLFVPQKFGGFESEWGDQIAVGRALSRGCGSTSWIACVVGSHPIYISRMDPRAQEDVWGNGPDVLVSTGSVIRDVEISEKPDGYILTGRWSFSSGIDHASWALLRASITGDARQSYFLIPKEELMIEDDWFVSGMRGTGSKTVFADKIFIPSYRVISLADMYAANPPGSKINRHYLSTESMRPFSGTNLMGPIMGTAEEILREFEEMMAKGQMGLSLDDPQTMLEYAEASAEIGAAKSLTDSVVQRQIAEGTSGQPIGKEAQISILRDRTYAAHLCMKGANRIVKNLGMRSVLTDDAIQRHHRDLCAMMQQIGVNWDRNMLNCAKASFDLPNDILTLS